MRYLFIAFVFLIGLSCEAQVSSQTARRIIRGAGEPSGSLCTVGTVSDVYVVMNSQSTASPLRVCTNTGVGTYAWVNTNAGAVVNAELTVENNGTPVGDPRDTINFPAVTGVTPTITDSGSKINISLAPDTAYLATRATVISAVDIALISATGPTPGSPTAYTASPTTAWTAYTDNMLAIWEPDTACTGSVSTTMNVSSLGAKRIYQIDGTSDPLAAQCTANSKVILVYDGALTAAAGGWRIMSGGGTTVTAAPPYMQLNSGTYYLPGMFGVTMPPGTGSWTAENAAGVTFSQINSRQLKLVGDATTGGIQAEKIAFGTNRVLTAAIAISKMIPSGSGGRCWVGIRSADGKAVAMGHYVDGATGNQFYEWGRWGTDITTGPSSEGGFQVSNMGYLLVRITAATTLLLDVSADGGASWSNIRSSTYATDLGATPQATDAFFFGVTHSGAIPECLLLSWNTVP